MLLEQLSKESGVRIERLLNFAETASRRYYVFPLDKRDGGKRWIAHPARSLKALQRWLNSRVFNHLPIHPSAMAYRKGVSIRMNATAHAGAAFTLRMDFKDFFPTFEREGVEKFLKQVEFRGGSSLDERDVSFMLDLILRYDQMTIGAPSSPILTNCMMYSFDQSVADYCFERGLIYTRYADDIFISSRQPNMLNEAEKFVQTVAREFPYSNLKINREKTAYLSRKFRRTVTGLVLTPDGKVSLGRDRKREIKALVHKFKIGKLDVENVAKLQGLIAFASDSDPHFYNALVDKYGRSTFVRLSKI